MKSKKVFNICKIKFSSDDNDKKCHKVRDHCHYTGKFRGTAHSTCDLRYKTPKEISVVYHNGSTYDHHFIINQLAKEFEGKLECLGENTVPINKELDKCKMGQLKPINGLVKKFPSICQFCNGDINKFVSLLRKGVLMNTWIAGKDLLKHCLIKKLLTVNCI